MSPWRSKIAAVLVLFFVGLFAGRVADLLNAVDDKVRAGNRLTDQIRSTVTTLRQIDTTALEAQIADLQAKLAAGTATPTQVSDLAALVGRLRAVRGPSGPTGPPGTPGVSGPPGPAATEPATTTSTSGPGATTTTRAATTTTATRPATTTTTRCLAGVGRLLKVGC